MPAGAGDAVAVDLEQGRHHGYVGKGLAKSRHVLPMQRRAAVIQQPCSRQDVWAARDAAEDRAFSRKPSQPREARLVVERRRVAARADEQHVGGALAARSAVGNDRDAVRGRHRLARRGRMPPAIQRLSREQVGRAQGLDGRGVGHQREVGHQKKADRPEILAHGGNGQTSDVKCQSCRGQALETRPMRYSHWQPSHQRSDRQPELEAGLARA